jgi:hypothetical protein
LALISSLMRFKALACSNKNSATCRLTLSFFALADYKAPKSDLEEYEPRNRAGDFLESQGITERGSYFGGEDVQPGPPAALAEAYAWNQHFKRC